MSIEKRKVSTDALETLGTIIEDGGRDAIHLAVEPVVAGERLVAGQDIGIKNGKAYNNLDKYYAHCDKHVGIVDPFLKSPVEPGQKFWLVVYPRQITSLRHVWSHPDFEDSVTVLYAKSESEQWVRDWIERTEYAPTYEDLISIAKTGTGIESDEYYGNRWSNEGDYLLSIGRDASGEIDPMLWFHLEIITGVKITMRPTHFSCSC